MIGMIVNVVENAVWTVRRNWREILIAAAAVVVVGTVLGLCIAPFIGVAY